MPVIDICIWLAAFAGGLTALGVIWTKGVRPLYRFFRRVEEVHSLITDDLPVFIDSTNSVLKQLQPNSGSSMFDRVARTEQLIMRHINNSEAHSARSTRP